VISQLVLSLVLPAPMVPLLILSNRPAVMGRFVAGRTTAIAAGVATAVVLPPPSLCRKL
jgi:manganese transport protein